MTRKLLRIFSLSWLIVLDGLRRHALLGLFVFALACVTGGILFIDFIPRDIGRASNDFFFSISWLTGAIFILFHGINAASWQDEKRAIHTFLARPISRSEYVLAVFSGLTILLLILNFVLSGTGWILLSFIKENVSNVYFQNLSFFNFIVCCCGVFTFQLVVLAVVIFFSSVVRGNLPVLLLTLSYYFICTGLPVVREAFGQEKEGKVEAAISLVLKYMTAVFPDFSMIDFKGAVVSEESLSLSLDFASPFILLFIYIGIFLWVSCVIYEKRDLQ